METDLITPSIQLHPVQFLTDTSCDLKHFLNQHHIKTDNTLIVTDDNFINYIQSNTFPELDFIKNYPLLSISGGEKTKSLNNLSLLYSKLFEANIGRDGNLIALGGGCIGDICGFAASTYMRGISLYQIPTTLMAMIDSSIGGKNAINAYNTKNLIGTFYQPKTVFIIPKLLTTLPQREFNAGIAEVIKYSLLEGNLEFLSHTQTLDTNNPLLASVIRESIETKFKIIGNDPNETRHQSPRMRLNLGHTFAHAIEAADSGENYIHGEAVAIGLNMAVDLSQRLGLLEGSNLPQILKALIKRYNLPFKLKKPLPLSLLVHYTSKDKKTVNQDTQYIVLSKPGSVMIKNSISAHTICETWLAAGAYQD